MKKRYRIKISRTEGEWKLVDRMIPDFSENGWSVFWKKHIADLRESYRKCPQCITEAFGEKQTRSVELTEGQYAVLKDIADKMKKPITSVLDELILSIVLRPEK